MILCVQEFAKEVADVNRRLMNMALGAIKQGIDGWRKFMREEREATLVARATSLEVQPGEGMTEARRRLAEEPVCLPASSFALKIGTTRRRRALAAIIDLDAVEAAKIKSFANGEPPVTVTAEQMALEDLGDSTVRVTIVQAEGGPTAQDITAAATLPAFLASMAEELGAPVGMEERGAHHDLDHGALQAAALGLALSAAALGAAALGTTLSAAAAALGLALSAATLTTAWLLQWHVDPHGGPAHIGHNTERLTGVTIEERKIACCNAQALYEFV